jgi:hypothetical protein
VTRLVRGHLGTIAVAVTVAVLAGAAWSQAANRGHRSPCSLSGSFTLYQDTRLRVYEKYFDGGERQETYACLNAANKRRKLAEFDDLFGGESVDVIRVRAPWIAYSLLGGSKGGGTWGYACVLNLRSGQRWCEPTDDYAVLGLGLTRAGSFAWMDSRYDATPGHSLSVHKLDAERHQAVRLDTGHDIDPDSFAVGGHHIYWTKAGAPQSATMP